jgi:hypothetical protein
MGLLAGEFLSACQNDYPLEPTPCDYWCSATERPSCGHVDPAECVALCEREFLPTCQREFTAVHECMAELPDSVACSREGYLAPRGFPCEAELMAYGSCRSLRDSPYE